MMKILIVDDNNKNLYFLESLLKGSGYEVETAVNGQQALEKLNSTAFDLIISDILMPVMDGFELCRRVKTDEHLKDIPFVFYTATYTDKKDKELALSLGASKFIIKPQEPEVFLKIIADILKETEKGTLKPRQALLEDERKIFKLYNERLIKKLEKKMLDLEKEKKARQKIEKEAKLLAHAVKSISESICITDMQGKIIFVNESFLNTYGYSKDEVIGQPITLFYSGNNAKELFEEIFVQTKKGGWKGELFQKKKDGTEFPVLLSTSLIRNEKNKEFAMIFVSSDISELRELEEQFRQTQKMEAIGRLAGGIAHDFNNLLTVINGYSELMLMRLKKDDPIYQQLNQISLAGRRAESLTRQLLAFSRKQVLQPVVLDIKRIIEDMNKMLHRLISENIELHTILEPNLCHIKADPSQIEQVVLNLVINARDAMPMGGKITIEAKNIVFKQSFYWEDLEIRSGKYLMLSISDTGTGMDAETKKRIFEPFFTTKKEGKGTGLGLATVYGIVKQSGGFVNVYSEKGIGSTFKLYFPCVKEPAEPIKSKTVSSESLTGTETILVAEDEDNLRNLVCEILRSHGYNVLEAANGGSALLKCEKYKKPIHLILSDVVMPEMSGAELVERLLPIHPEMKVMYMSGYTDDAVIRHGILEEKVQFLQKPFSPNSLLEKVRSILDNKQ